MLSKLLNRKLSLKEAIILPFIVILIVTLSFIFYTDHTRYNKLIHDISRRSLDAYTQKNLTNLRFFLDTPLVAAKNIATQIQQQRLYQYNNLKPMQSFLQEIYTNLYINRKQIQGLSFGSKQQEYIGFLRYKNNELVLALQDNRTNQELLIYDGNTISNNITYRDKNYDARQRPWYIPSSKKQQASWSDIYRNNDAEQISTITFSEPIFYAKELIGVLAVDIDLDEFNAFLRQRKSPKSDIYLIDEHQHLVAHSQPHSVLSKGTEFSKKETPLFAIESENIAIKQSALYIQEHKLTTLKKPTFFNFTFNDERYFSQIAPYVDENGLNWHMVTTISEKDLLGNLQEEQNNNLLLVALFALIGLSIAIYFIGNVTQPIFNIAYAARKVAIGEWSYKIKKISNINETSQLIDSFNYMTDKLQRTFKIMKRQITHDSLTQLYTYQGFIEKSEFIFSPAKDQMQQGIILIKIHGLNDISDSLGHLISDQATQYLAQRLKENFPSDKYIIGRTARAQFAILLTELYSQEELEQKTITLQHHLHAPIHITENTILLNCSIGLVYGHLNNSDIVASLTNASIALKQSLKRKENYCFYTEDMTQQFLNRTQMIGDLSDAIEYNEIVPFYQPVIDLKTGKITGAEALARWLSPKRGLVSPLDFIPLAEDNGMIVPIGNQILKQACIDTVSNIKKGAWSIDFHMHVNLSVAQLKQHTFLQELKKIVEETGINPNNLTLELTESKLIEHAQNNTIEIIKNIQTFGIKIAIDDFGTGYSSLSYLTELPFDILKVDRTFIKDLTPDNVHSSIAATIVNLTKNFDITLVAEGIETKEQAELLINLKYHHGQGFLYGKPAPLSEWPEEKEI